MKKLLIAALCFGLFASAAEAKTRLKDVAPAQPSVLSCVFMPFPGNGCPVIERVVGAAAWGLGIGMTAGAGLALIPVAHAVVYGTVVGVSAGAVSPLVLP